MTDYVSRGELMKILEGIVLGEKMKRNAAYIRGVLNRSPEALSSRPLIFEGRCGFRVPTYSLSESAPKRVDNTEYNI